MGGFSSSRVEKQAPIDVWHGARNDPSPMVGYKKMVWTGAREAEEGASAEIPALARWTSNPFALPAITPGLVTPRLFGFSVFLCAGKEEW